MLPPPLLNDSHPYLILTSVAEGEENCLSIYNRPETIFLGTVCRGDSVLVDPNWSSQVPEINTDGDRWERVCIFDDVRGNVPVETIGYVRVGKWEGNGTSYTGYFDYEWATEEEIDTSACGF